MNISNTTGMIEAPLEACLLVDYRLSSRTRLKEFIHATKLFQSIHEPGTLSLGLEMVSKLKIETCIFGPSVKPERIQDFIVSTHSSIAGEKCAFLVFQHRERREDVSGAHSVVEFPCMQPNFNLGIVRALAEAHGGTLPASRKIDPRTGRPISLKTSLARLEFPGHEPKKNETHNQIISGQAWSRQLIELVVKRSPKLYQQLLEIKPFELKFRSDGVPSDFTLKVIRGVIDVAFAETEDVPDIERFRNALEILLCRWVKKGTLHGRAAADFVFRRELRDCLQGRAA